MSRLEVINNSGKKEVFSRNKLYLSIRRAGASKALAEKICDAVEKEIYPEIQTKEIFKKVQKILLKENPRSGIRYGLKEAMRLLGPSGFPFEKYVGDIFEQLGFSVVLNQYLQGICVFHEIDILAKEKKYLLIGECKYHILPGARVDLKVGLVHYARFLDLKSGDFFKKTEFKNLKPRPIIITNTKFTTKIIKYAECTGIDLLGWKYPELRGLEYIIESQGFYPITILPSFKGQLLEIFSQEKLMLVQDLLEIDTAKFCKKTGLSQKKISILKKEAEILLLE